MSNRPEVSDQLWSSLQDVYRSWSSDLAGASWDEAKQLVYGILIRNGWKPPRG